MWILFFLKFYLNENFSFKRRAGGSVLVRPRPAPAWSGDGRFRAGRRQNTRARRYECVVAWCRWCVCVFFFSFERKIIFVFCFVMILVKNLNLVVNFDMPLLKSGKPDPETYLHRIGRTGNKYKIILLKIYFFLSNKTRSIWSKWYCN